MKILIHTYDTAFQNQAGGVHNRIVRIVEGLRSRGIQVDYFDKYSTNIEEYDCLHIFKLDAGTRQLVEYAHAVGVKVVISTIVSLEKGKLISLYWLIRKIPFATVYRQIFTICNNTDLFIVETLRELIFMEKYYHVQREKMEIIPNGADRINSKSRMIFKKIGKDCKYALVVGRFDSNKNQKTVIEAMIGTDVEVVFIGGPDPNCECYYEECQKIASKSQNIHLLGWVKNDDELFKSALTNACAIVCPSFQETFGLSIVEGVMEGAVPIISNTLPILDFPMFKNCATFNPKDAVNVKNTIVEVMNDLESYKLKVDDSFSWDKIIEKHINCYECVIKNSRGTSK